MNYYNERKRKLFANDNLHSTDITIKQNISLRKNDLNEKLLNKRLNYTNNILKNSIFELNPNDLLINEEEKKYQFDEMVFIILIFLIEKIFLLITKIF